MSWVRREALEELDPDRANRQGNDLNWISRGNGEFHTIPQCVPIASTCTLQGTSWVDENYDSDPKGALNNERPMRARTKSRSNFGQGQSDVVTSWKHNITLLHFPLSNHVLYSNGKTDYIKGTDIWKLDWDTDCFGNRYLPFRCLLLEIENICTFQMALCSVPLTLLSLLPVLRLRERVRLPHLVSMQGNDLEIAEIGLLLLLSVVRKVSDQGKQSRFQYRSLNDCFERWKTTDNAKKR